MNKLTKEQQRKLLETMTRTTWRLIAIVGEWATVHGHTDLAMDMTSLMDAMIVEMACGSAGDLQGMMNEHETIDGLLEAIIARHMEEASDD